MHEGKIILSKLAIFGFFRRSDKGRETPLCNASSSYLIVFWQKQSDNLLLFCSLFYLIHGFMLFFFSLQESILAISFSNKASRYVCSGGTGQVVRIWDLQRKRCIKWLKGHTNTVTGVIYNCKDEHLASISLSGDLMLHNLASGQKTAELKDPNQQVFLLCCT